MHRLLAVALLFPVPVAVVAAELPVSFEADAGVGVVALVREEAGLGLPRGSRVLVYRKEETGESPVGSVGGTLRYRFSEGLDGFARLQWHAASRVAQNYSYAFSNGDFISGTSTTLQKISASSAMIGLRRTAPATGCWSTEFSADLRHFDSAVYEAYPLPFGGPSVVAKSEDDAIGFGIGAAVACRIAERWSVVLGGEAALLDEYEQYAASLSLRWTIR